MPVHKERKGQLEQLALKVRKEQPGYREQQEPQVLKGRPDFKDRLVSKDHKGTPDLKGRKVRKGPRDWFGKRLGMQSTITWRTMRSVTMPRPGWPSGLTAT